MSEYTPPPPPPEQPPTGGTPPPPPPPQPGGYGAPPPVTAGVPRPAELLDRFLARLIDGVLFAIVVYLILGAILAALLVNDGGINFATGEVDTGSRVLYNIVFGIISTLLYLGYYVFLESTRGQTIGKMIMKIRTFGPDGTSNPTMEQSLKRNIWMATGILAILGTLGSLLGSLIQLGAVILIAVNISSDTVKRQSWFDHFAGETQVKKIG